MEHLPDATVRLLGSTQVITSVFSVVKELVENSLDAGATSVDVKLENYGLDKIEVRDNGGGICAEDVPVFAKRHYTSKIRSHADLEVLTTYGFRGEALASLCAVSEVTVTTKTASQDVGFSYSLSAQGDVTSTTPSALPQGTTVCSKNLFKNLPVRKQYHSMAKKKKEDLKSVENLLMAYGVILPAVRISLRHNKELVWQKVALQDSAAAMLSLHGKGIMGQMEWRKQEFHDPEVKIELCLPKPGSDVAAVSRSTPDKSFLCVNGRPVTVKEIDKLVRQYYSNCHACDMGRHPVYFIRLELPAGDVDVNLEPNKTTVMTTNMAAVREKLEEMLLYMYGPLDQAPSWRYRDADAGGTGSKPSEEQGNSNELRQFQKDQIRFEEKSKTSVDAATSSMASGEKSDIAAPVIIFHEKLTSDRPLSVVSEKTGALVNGKMNDTPEAMVTGSSLAESKTCTQVDSTQEQTKVNEIVGDSNFDLGTDILDEVLCSFPVSSAENKECEQMSKLSGENGVHGSTTVDTGDKITGDSETVGHTESRKTEPSGGSENAGTVRDQETGCPVPVSETPKAGPSGWSHGTSVVSATGAPVQPVQLLAPTPAHIPGKRPISPSHDAQVQKQMAPAQKRLATMGRRLCPAQSTLYDMINNVAVKRPTSAREIFFNERRPKVVEEHSQADYDEVTQILAEMWECLSDEERIVYREKSWQDAQRYNSEAAAAKNVAGKVKANTKSRPQVESARDVVAAMSTQPTPKPGKKTPVTFSSQRLVPFSMADLSTCMNGDPTSSQIFFPCPQVLAFLPSCKAWVCGRGAALSVLNLHRLSETVLYHRLRRQHKLVPHHCQPLRLLPSNLGTCWPVLEKLAESCLTLDPFTHITDSRIAANGLHIKCWKDADGSLCAELIGVCSDVPTYGLSDLREILELINKSSGRSLAETRPLKVDNYLRGEAVRMARQATSDKSLEDVQDLLQQSASILPPGCSTCLHHKPFFHPLVTDIDAATAASGGSQSELDATGSQQSMVGAVDAAHEAVLTKTCASSNISGENGSRVRDGASCYMDSNDDQALCLDDLMDSD